MCILSAHEYILAFSGFIIYYGLNFRTPQILKATYAGPATVRSCPIFPPYFKVSISSTTRSRWGMIHFSLRRIRSMPNRWRFNISRFRVFYRTSIKWCIRLCLSSRLALHRLSAGFSLKTRDFLWRCRHRRTDIITWLLNQKYRLTLPNKYSFLRMLRLEYVDYGVFT